MSNLDKWVSELDSLEWQLLQVKPELKDEINEIKNNQRIRDYLDGVSFLFSYEKFLKEELSKYENEASK